MMTPNTPSPNDTANHKAKLWAHLMTGQRINGYEALYRYQCFALSQRMGDLRRAGIPIQSRFITTSTGKRIKEYWLEPSHIQQHTA